MIDLNKIKLIKLYLFQRGKDDRCFSSFCFLKARRSHDLIIFNFEFFHFNESVDKNLRVDIAKRTERRRNL